MTELEKQWRRGEQVKWVFIALVGIFTMSLGFAIIAHSIHSLAAKCSL